MYIEIGLAVWRVNNLVVQPKIRYLQSSEVYHRLTLGGFFLLNKIIKSTRVSALKK